MKFNAKNMTKTIFKKILSLYLKIKISKLLQFTRKYHVYETKQTTTENIYRPTVSIIGPRSIFNYIETFVNICVAKRSVRNVKKLSS